MRDKQRLDQILEGRRVRYQISENGEYEKDLYVTAALRLLDKDFFIW